MKLEHFIKQLQSLSITTVTGIPDSQLKVFCDYMNHEGKEIFNHIVPAHEGAAVAIAAGSYLATGHPACVYMQNSGIGNALNPIASLIHKDVYEIPMLFLIGYRGEPGIKDEPQHIFQGRITAPLFDVLEIPYAFLGKNTSNNQLDTIFQEAGKTLSSNHPYAIIVEKDSFAKEISHPYQNKFMMKREQAIQIILSKLDHDTIIVSTTGKISREVYEQGKRLGLEDGQCFLTVGSMGHASMIAYGIALQKPNCRVICLDGDGAAFMHMGALKFLGTEKPANLIHIVFNNQAHESVGGMPIGAPDSDWTTIAAACGYPNTCRVQNETELHTCIDVLLHQKTPALSLTEVQVALGSRDDLGRPKETPIENKLMFMKKLKG